MDSEKPAADVVLTDEQARARKWDDEFSKWENAAFPLDPNSETPKPGKHPVPDCKWNIDEFNYLKERDLDAGSILKGEKTEVEEY